MSHDLIHTTYVKNQNDQIFHSTKIEVLLHTGRVNTHYNMVSTYEINEIYYKNLTDKKLKSSTTTIQGKSFH